MSQLAGKNHVGGEERKVTHKDVRGAVVFKMSAPRGVSHGNVNQRKGVEEMLAYKLVGIGIGMLWTLCGSYAVFAQGPTAPVPASTVQERLDSLEKKVEAPSIWKTLGFKASGFLDVAYTHNFNNPNSNLNQLHIFDTHANSISTHMVQLLLERPADAAGSGMDRAGFHSRLNFGLDARVTKARTNFAPGASNSEVDFQEVYGEYIAPIGNGLKIQAGKINTLIGYEVINSFENPNFSRSFMFGLGQAFTTTGIRASYTFNPVVTASIGLINGWDNVDDNNKGKSFEWLLALTPHEKFGMSFYGSYGAEQTNSQGTAAASTGVDPTAKRTVVGTIMTIKATDQDTIVLEPYYGNEGNASTVSRSRNARWNGLASYLTHDFSDQWSARFRGEIFEDAGGARTCSGTFGSAGGTNTCAGATSTVAATPVAQTLWENTFTLQYKPCPALITRTEFRYDKSDKNTFLYGSRAVNNQETLSFQIIYLF